MYKLKSLNQNMWWKDRSIGYTTDLSEAGLYHMEVARNNCRDANTNGKINLIQVDENLTNEDNIPTSQQDKRSIKEVLKDIKNELESNKKENPVRIIVSTLENNHYYLSPDLDKFYYSSEDYNDLKMEMKIHGEYDEIFNKNRKELYVDLNVSQKEDGTFNVKLGHRYGEKKKRTNKMRP